ncbi:MAG: PleD family two-component system response regulator [Deltaproteobacteria bacterium]|nr:PleD family two-component system response regulator [Deltaproteobacteria bacterium]
MSDENDRQKILIVDDEPADVRVIYELLRNDYEVFFAVTGEKALAMAESEQIDLILLDIMMPGMDGYEICRRLKGAHRTKDIPVIFITAKITEKDEVRGFDLGAVDYITKPISPTIVRARVKSHIQLKLYRDILENLSATDGLTGIPNRRRFDEFLEAEWRRSVRSGSYLSMLMIDIDFFKPYNDHYGHLAGDECLKQIGRALTKTVKRSADLMARYGGEEFACILPETNSVGATVVGGKLRDRVATLGIIHEYSSIAGHVTISLGVATMIPLINLLPMSLVRAADELLYQAKRNGRNRLVTRDFS